MFGCLMLVLRAVWGRGRGLGRQPGVTSVAVGAGAVGAAAAPSKTDSNTWRSINVR